MRRLTVRINELQEEKVTGQTDGTADTFNLLPSFIVPPLKVLEIILQPNGSSTLQLFDGKVPLSGVWSLGANQFWCAPGKRIIETLSLVVGSAVIVNYEIRWVNVNGDC